MFGCALVSRLRILHTAMGHIKAYKHKFLIDIADLTGLNGLSSLYLLRLVDKDQHLLVS